MELRIFGRDAIEQYVPDRVEVCISISDPSAPPARLSPGFAAVLRLYFSDIVAAVDPEDVLFAPQHAAGIVEFMGRWRHAERLVVHCNVGQSRSPGVALGLCDRFGWPAAELERRYPFWNRWVRQTLSNHPQLEKQTMIARQWHGRVRAADADAYYEYLLRTGLLDYQRTPGNRGVQVLRRREGDAVHYLLTTLWDSWDSIRAFAGEDVERARYYPEDTRYLLELEPTVTHFEVLELTEDGKTERR